MRRIKLFFTTIVWAFIALFSPDAYYRILFSSAEKILEDVEVAVEDGIEEALEEL